MIIQQAVKHLSEFGLTQGAKHMSIHQVLGEGSLLLHAPLVILLIPLGEQVIGADESHQLAGEEAIAPLQFKRVAEQGLQVPQRQLALLWKQPKCLKRLPRGPPPAPV